MVFGIVVYKFPGDGMVAPGKHGTMRRFFNIAFGIGFCRVEVVLCCFGVMRRCLLMIFNCFFMPRCVDGWLAFAGFRARRGNFFFVVHAFIF